ncbi:hypothetical protein pqer_cds_254 [Pandoravirus quercus]|uniref:Uncharacterized protein n=1 Tax=Pandoravirus quercus TaxID=2107709 RepID=A0A2U7U8C1_9VIRU|nr:hypothetical protein pqer_cds_254 [Pandoravirus quercus]AVK74676.1 hypothetical protein pqer_cds_254 [Pandoravirus quercus]
MSGIEERRHRHHRHGHEDRDRQPTRADHEGADLDGDNTPWDPRSDLEIGSLRANSVNFTQTDGGDPDAVVQLHMGRDLGIYARTRSTRRRIDAVAPGKPGLLAAYAKGSAVGPVDWARVEADPETGTPTLHVGGNVAVNDVLIKERGSVGTAIDALREAVILGDQHRVALERRIKELDEALSASESRVDELVRLVRGMQHIRVEHESEATAAAWLFRTSLRPDGTNVFAVVSSDGVPRTTYCAYPQAPPAIQDDGGDGDNTNSEETVPHHAPIDDIVPAHLSDEAVMAMPKPATEAPIMPDLPTPTTDEQDNNKDAPPETAEPDNDGVAITTVDAVVTDTPATTDHDVTLAAAARPIEPIMSDEPMPTAIPIPTQQRRTKGARKARSTTTEAPGSPPPAATRGVKTRQSARRASAFGTAAHADPPAVVTMARPADGPESA